MANEITLKILKTYNNIQINNLTHILNTEGYLSDESNKSCLSSVMIENWNDKCTNYIRNFGYVGGKLSCYAKYFSTKGGIYLLFNTEKISLEEAKLILETIAKN